MKRICLGVKIIAAYLYVRRHILYRSPALLLSHHYYETLGVGSVGWFDTAKPTTEFWADMFDGLFVWRNKFHEQDPHSLSHQIEWLKEWSSNRELSNIYDPLFLFWNIGTMHFPYRLQTPYRIIEEQVEALEHIDLCLPDILDLIPKPATVVICSDHGECFGELDADTGYPLFGHGFYHPKVMEVPMMIVEL